MTPKVRTAAIMMVRNEQSVIASSIGHLLRMGVGRVYVTDNGSTDHTAGVLRRISAKTGRVVVNADTGPFRQGEILTDLSGRAVADGAQWLLPADADEFLWLRPGTSLEDLCARAGIGGYRVAVRNFLQARPARREWRGTLTTMCVSAEPFGAVSDGRSAVTSGAIPFVRINYPTKLFLRATPQLQIAFGHHDATGTAGPLVPLADGCLLHAPIRSMSGLRRRMESGRRAAEVSPDPGQNWHNKRVAAMSEVELAEEWRRNTYAPLHPAQRGSTVLDFRLSRIGLRQAGFTAALGRL